MKKMKINIIAIAAPIFLLSCGPSELEESVEKTEDCIEEKYDEAEDADKTAFKSVDDALTVYDFVAARSILSCHENSKFNKSNGDRVTWNDAYNPYKVNYRKIVLVEVNYYLKAGSFGKARSSASEAEMLDIYDKALPNAINDAIDEKKFDAVVGILSKHTFHSAYNLSEKYNTNANESYNEEANAYNDMVNSLFTSALLNEDKSVLRKSLLLYAPMVRKKSTNSKTCKLVHVYKNKAKSKLLEAMVSL